jgi:Tol biopolymer transport system component
LRPDSRGSRLIIVYDAAWSPDARAVALLATPYVGDRMTRLLLVDVRTRRLRTLASGDVASAPLSWSPDGTSIAYATSDAIRIVRVADGQTELSIPVPAQVDAHAWSPDGTRIAFTARRVPQG